uniref:F-box domain-containing protein n=1 Tax=Caenorhabditis tropicalis TaxID=1561998 RepID=A0A1I7UAY6_9PELO
MSFYLFSLPQSVYTDIINSMNPCEQFFTSLCSRNAYKLVRKHRQKAKLRRIITEGNFQFQLYDADTTEFRQLSNIPNRDLKEMVINGNTIQYELKENKEVLSYWTEPIEGTMALIEYVSDLFNVVVDEMDIFCNSGERLMLWVQRRQTRLNAALFHSNSNKKNRFTPEALTSLIEVCEAKAIILDAYTTKPLQPFHKKCNYFDFLTGSRLTVEHLMTLDCVEILASEKHNFKSAEMNRFFKHWISGGSPRLTLLEVHLDIFNERKLLAGINVKWNASKMNVRTSDEKTFLFDGFFEILKITNGKSTGFKFLGGMLYFGVWPCSVPLFCLPHLAFMGIINAMSTSEQVLTSLCSRRAFSTIKSLRRGSGDIPLSAGDNFLAIGKESTQLTIYQHTIDSGQREVVTVNGKLALFGKGKKKSDVHTFWKKPVIGTKELIEHASNLFGIHVEVVTVGNRSGTELMNWVQRRQGSLKTNCTSLNPIRDSRLAWEVRNIQLCKRNMDYCRQFNDLGLYPYQELLDGLDAPWNDEKAVISNGRPYNGFFEIVRSDGVTAGFKIMDNRFWIGAWPSDNRDLFNLDSF